MSHDNSVRPDSLLIDTGSSNTWVGAGKPYVPTSSSINLNEEVVRTSTLPRRLSTEQLCELVSYLRERWLRRYVASRTFTSRTVHMYLPGFEWQDTVTVGELVIAQQSIGVAVDSSGFAGVDGILG